MLTIAWMIASLALISSAQAQDGPSIAVCNSTCVNDSSTHTGAWVPTPSRQSSSPYLSANLTGTAITQAHVTINMQIAAPGSYSVRLHTPGCLQDATCPDRGSVNITGLMYGSLSASGSGLGFISTQISQHNNFDKYDEVYNGYVNATSTSFVPHLNLTPIALDVQNGLITVVAQRVESLFNSSGSSLPPAAPSTPNPTTTLTSSNTATPTPLHRQHGLSRGGRIRLGIGIPLGLIAIIILLAVAYTIRRRPAAKRNLPHEVDGTTAHGEFPTNANTAEMPAPPSYQELHPQTRPVELKATY